MTDRDDPADEDPVRSIVEHGTPDEVRMFLATLSAQEAADLLEAVDEDLRERLFPMLDLQRQAKVLREVETETARVDLLEAIPDARVADIAEVQRTDDASDLMAELTEERRGRVLDEIEPEFRGDIEELAGYAPDTAGGLMQKELIKLREDLTVAQATEQLRRDWDAKIGDVYDIYVVDAEDRLLGRIRNRHLLINPPDRPIRDFMRPDVRKVPVTMDQEEIAEIVKDYDLASLAVVDAQDHLIGRILVDDVVDVMDEEATEDIQKLGGMEALGESYLHVRLGRMVRKRGVWLAALFLGEMLTASAMGYFEDELKKAIVLSMFIPLIVSSGGNSGSQATALVIRAMALGEIKLRDWWRVVQREFATGLALGALLGGIGAARIVVWQLAFHVQPSEVNPDGTLYGPHYLLVALTVGTTLVGIVLWGTLAGSMLPFLLRRMRFDPASASAPFVATLVDVTGIVIYFSVASVALTGTLL